MSSTIFHPMRPAADAMRTIRMMHLLEWIGGKFNDGGIPIMALKGAALHLTLYRQPQERPMADVDILVKPDDLDRALALLEQLGHHRDEVPFREDFFPRYYYEVEYRAGSIAPAHVDLHVRPFRMLRLARFVPDDAMWQRAVPVTFGKATVLVPAPDDMLIHLAAHSAIHGNDQRKWLVDIDRWIRRHRSTIDWDRFLATAAAWRVSLAVRRGIEAAERLLGPSCPAEVRRRLVAQPANWRDRLALWHAPRDGRHLARSFAVNALTTPGCRFVLGYLRDVLLPDRTYLSEWSARHACPWPHRALVLRYAWPLVESVPNLHRRLCKVQVRSSPVHGLGVFATRDLRPGEVIAWYRGRPVDRDGTYVSVYTGADGRELRHEITGPLKYVNHSCRPNAELGGFRLRALVPIRAGQEVTMSYGEDACDCDQQARRMEGAEHG